MSFDEKYQAGTAYADEDSHVSSATLLSDPVEVAKNIIKDYAGARCEATLPELIGLVKGLLDEGQGMDDRKGATEILISILAGLPSTSKIRVQLTDKLIDTLWNNLQHPPLSYVGGDVKYAIVGSKEAEKHDEEYDAIEFDAPDGSGVRLREEVPKHPNGFHQYRMPDGSFNNILEPHLGRAGSPYAKSVRSGKTLHGVRPDAGQLFDLLLAREDGGFRENPAGISSMLFYHASIIIHDIFRTSRTDVNKSDTSSYLDLAPLYGSSLRDQLKIRTMKGGMLKPDTFHEKRLIGQPAGVNVMLVLYNRFHNYVCDVLLKINEGGRFTLACAPDASAEDKAKALAKQDHDLFNTARLITCAMYAGIALGDYLRAIVNLHHSSSDWSLDPRVAIDKQFDGEGVPRGVGNQVSVEFNLLYRFHSCISQKDERWINNFFLKLFPGRKPDEFQNVSMPELGQAMLRFEQSIDPEPSKRTFSDLERQEDTGKFKDEDLVRVLKEGMDDPAGAFGSRMVPKALKIIEIQGIIQARKWGVASLNEFREFFGLRRYNTFQEINSDKDISNALKNLYTDPDMVELYPGLMVEDIKPVRNPGTGICPTYTVGRAVLADAITLVRSDRFLTVDFTVASLTNWGLNEIKHDPKTLGGSMLYKLIQRGLPGWFPFNSVAVMQPMYTKKKNIEIAKELGTIDQYTLDDPKPPPGRALAVSSASIKRILDNPKQYPSGWARALNLIFPGKKDLSWFMLAGDEPRNYEHRARMTAAMRKLPGNLSATVAEFIERVGSNLIQKESFRLDGKDGAAGKGEGLRQLDIVRDVAIPLNAQLLADLYYFDLRTDENPSGTLSVAELYRNLTNLRIWITNGTDAAELWNRRRRAQEGGKVIIDTTRKLVDEVNASRGLGLGLISSLSNVTTRKKDIKKGSLRECGWTLVEELLNQGNSAENVVDQLWLMAFGATGVLVTTFYEVMEFFLRKENASIWAEVQDLAQKNDKATLQKYVHEAQRITSPFRIIRYATKPDEIDKQPVKPGDIVILDIAGAARNTKEIPDADKFDPNRKQPDVTGFSYGKHECFGKHLSLVFVTGMVKLAAGLKNLRPAPGPLGQVKIINVGFDKIYMNDSWSMFGFNTSTWKIQFDGYGKGNFKGGNEQDQDSSNLEKYYFMLKKTKDEIVG